MKSVMLDCPSCCAPQTLTFAEPRGGFDFACGSCGKNITLVGLDQLALAICPVCACRDIYQHKDFNKTLGFAVFLTGAILVPWTYAISIIVALVLDAALYPFFPWMAVCYQCKAELRGWGKNPRLTRFSHEIAAKYEYGRTKWPSSPH